MTSDDEKDRLFNMLPPHMQEEALRRKAAEEEAMARHEAGLRRKQVRLVATGAAAALVLAWLTCGEAGVYLPVMAAVGGAAAWAIGRFRLSQIGGAMLYGWGWIAAGGLGVAAGAVRFEVFTVFFWALIAIVTGACLGAWSEADA